MQTPPNAIFSGYSMPATYYKKLASALRSPPSRPPTSETRLMQFVNYYDGWRRQLPDEDYPKAPSLKILNKPDWEENPNTRLFFPTRWAPVGEDNEPAGAHQSENEADKARRDGLLALIVERNNFEVDKDVLQFECMKGIHPLHDRYYGI